jgi:hypothetical protein
MPCAGGGHASLSLSLGVRTEHAPPRHFARADRLTRGGAVLSAPGTRAGGGAASHRFRIPSIVASGTSGLRGAIADGGFAMTMFFRENI